jgi:hypothetical protein
VAIKKALVANKNLHISFKKFQILGNVANKNFGLAKALTLAHLKQIMIVVILSQVTTLYAYHPLPGIYLSFVYFQMEIVLEMAHKCDESQSSAPTKDRLLEKIIFLHTDVVTITALNVDLDYANRGKEIISSMSYCYSHFH